MLLCFYVNLRCCTTNFTDSPWRHGFTAAWKSGGAAGATHVQISWISAWIPSEVTRTFFFDLPIWDSNASSFSCRSFSSQREPTVVGSITGPIPAKGKPHNQVHARTHASQHLKQGEREVCATSRRYKVQGERHIMFIGTILQGPRGANWQLISSGYCNGLVPNKRKTITWTRVDPYPCCPVVSLHCSDVIMSAMASQIISVSIVHLAVCSGSDQRKHQSSASLAFEKGIHQWPVNSPHKGPVMQKMFPFADVIMEIWLAAALQCPQIKHLQNGITKMLCLKLMSWLVPCKLNHGEL